MVRCFTQQARAPSGIAARPRQSLKGHGKPTAPGKPYVHEFCPNTTVRTSSFIVHAASLQTDIKNAGPQPEAPPPKPVEVEAKLVQLEGSTTMIQCFCRTHLRYEAEYGLKRGTTTNCYLLEDVREIKKLEKAVHTVVLTHLNPDIVETLTQTLQIVRKPSAKVVLVLSNPAMQVLQAKLDASEDGEELLAGLELRVLKSEEEVEVGRRILKCVPASTPRYPDMLCVYERTTRRLFSSCLFSAHVNPQLGVVGTDGMDRGGWEVFGNDWQFFFDCMFAPVAKPTLAALNKLNIAAATANNNTPLLVQLARLLTGSKPSPDAPNPMPVKMIFPRHGPIVRQSVTQLVSQYDKCAPVHGGVSNL